MGAVEALILLRRAGVRIRVVTLQSAVGRGMMPAAAVEVYDTLHCAVLALLEEG